MYFIKQITKNVSIKSLLLQSFVKLSTGNEEEVFKGLSGENPCTAKRFSLFYNK